MSSAKGNNNKLPSNLPQLQNLIKRDADSYIEEFERQHSVYNATRTIFEQNPTVNNDQLYELVIFLAQVAHCYPKQLSTFPQELMTILQRHGTVLNADMRMAFVKSLVLLRNKNMLTPTDLLMLFFKLLRCQDKVLRIFLQDHIVTDIKNINAKSKNMKMNKELQNFMFEMLKDNHAVAAKMSLDVMIDLYKKQVWNDSKTVNIITTACFSKIAKVMVAAIKFFVGQDEEQPESDSDSDEDDAPNVKAALMAARVNKAKKKNQRKVDKAKSELKKRAKKKKNKAVFDFSALNLIRDPQDLAEKLYRKLEKMNERFEVKLMTMNFISRLVGVHQLYLPNFYPLVMKFLFPHQREVTKVMVYAAQAAHPQVPPEELEPVVRTLANNFVTERHSNEVMAMGLNAIRALCARNPHCMSDDLLQDLTEYKSHKDKGVMMAARSLIALFREQNPELLKRKDRAAPTELSREEGTTTQYGVNDAKDYIPGAEILSFNIKGADKKKRAIDDDSDSSDDEGWINVTHDGGEGDSDEDDEGGWETDSGHEEGEDDEEENPAISKKEAIQKVMEMTAEERQSVATDIVTTRFLTDEDFARIEATQAAKKVEKYKKNNKNKRKREEDKDGNDNDDIVRLKSIEMIYKKRKHDKETRVGTIMAGREGRDKFGSKKSKLNPQASTTNKQKLKNKAFSMVKHKVRGKQKQSFATKQRNLRDSLLKRERNSY